HQVKSVQQRENMIVALVQLENIMMIYPMNANHHKTENVSKIRWPRIREGQSQLESTVTWLETGYLYLQDKQRDGDGKYPIAEGFDAMCRYFSFRFWWV